MYQGCNWVPKIFQNRGGGASGIVTVTFGVQVIGSEMLSSGRASAGLLLRNLKKVL